MIDTKEIEIAIKDSIKSKVDNLISEFDIKTMIARTIDNFIAEKVTSSISAHVTAFIQKGKLEKEFESKVEKEFNPLFEQEIKVRTANAIARIDLATEVGKHIDKYLESRITSAALPENLINHKAINWDGFYITANAISNGTIKTFSSTGIQDVADQVELTVADNLVVIENKLVTRSIEVKDQLTVDSILVNDIKIGNQLILNEDINKQFKSLIKDELTRELSTRQIDIVDHPITANGKQVLTDNTLGPSIINSNLRKLGRLNELNVSGTAVFGETMIITDAGRVGINTSDPEGAFTVWDDDSDLTIKRHKKKNMYVGTMQDVELSLGINGDVKLALRKDGSVEMSKILLNGLKISVSDTVPQDPGSPGEIVIMSNAQINEPWAYRCVNGAWAAIK